MADIRQQRHPTARKSEGSWPVSYRWFALGTLVAYSAVGTRTISVAHAQEPLPQGAAVDSLAVKQFDITAGPLARVLDEFRALTDIDVVCAAEGIRSLDSPGVRGFYTPAQALSQILSQTGVSFRFNGPSAVTLDLRGPDTTIVVSEKTEVASPRYTEPVRDLPQTITVIPKTLIEEQGATTLRDVLRNVPGLTIAAGEGGTPAGDNLTLRGFSARNDIFVDGVRDLGPQSRDPFNVEQVEVVKGPQSAFVGRGSTGGSINMVSKAPGLSEAFGATFNAGTDSTRRLTTDINLPLGRIGFGERTAFRLNGLAHHSGVAGRDVTENNRWGVAPSLALGLGTPTRLTFSYLRMKQDNIPDYGIPWVPATNNALVEYRDRPAPVPRDTFYGLKNRDFERMGSDSGTVRFEHDFTDGVTLRNQLRYGRSTRDSLTTPPRFLNNDSTLINREARSWITRDGIWDNQADVTLHASTGPVQHSVVTGVGLTRESNLRRTRTTTGTSVTTMLNPNPEDAFAGTDTISPITANVTGNTQAAYAFDTMKIGEHWQATGGLRWERFDVDGITTAGAPVARVDRMASVRAGLVYKPVERASFYTSYGTSMNPSLEGLSYNTVNTNIPPEKTYTIEAGTKWDVAGERLMLTGAAFQVEKTNARTPPLNPDEPPQVLQGTQRVRGFELGASGSMTRHWKLFGAYTYLESEIAKSNTPAEVGKHFQNTPRNSGNLWTSYELRKLTIGGGPRFTGRRYGNNANTRMVDAFWTLDLLASWSVNDRVQIRFNLYNANNAYYFDRLGGGHVIPGAARSAMVTTSFRF